MYSIPHLLEIRDFPKRQLTEEVVNDILQGLRNCSNLRSCTWTRDGSLTSDILLALSRTHSLLENIDSPLSTTSIPSLRELEINGHHSHLFDPKLLLQFQWLTKISIIVPTLEVIRVLEEWVQILQGTLKSLNLICKVCCSFVVAWTLLMDEWIFGGTDITTDYRRHSYTHGAISQELGVLSFDWMSESYT